MKNIRVNLLKYGTASHTEEFVLRELFREHDRDNNGVLSLETIRLMLNKVNIAASDQYLQALVNRVDINATGVLEFEELVAFLVQDRYTKTSLK